MPDMGSLPSFSGTDWKPTIDSSRGVNQTAYAKDLAECEALANTNPEADVAEAKKKGAMSTGLMAAVPVVALTAATGGLALPLMGMAAVTVGGSAVVGGGAKGRGAEMTYRSMVTECLKGRGYSVVG